MNFVLISPVGADVDLMPKTRPAGRPGRVSQHRHRGDTSTGCCLIARNPFRTDHENSLGSRDKLEYASRLENARTFLAVSLKILSVRFIAFRVHYRFPYQQSTSTFTATYATQHIITITIPNAAGCGHQGRLTTNHRPSAMANDMSLLSITGFGTTRNRGIFAFANFNPALARNRAFRLRIHPYRNKNRR